jgi:hypothetical protein
VTDFPDTPANCSAADRNPARFHVWPSSTRRAINVIAEPDIRFTEANIANRPGALGNGTAFGSSARKQLTQQLLDHSHIALLHTDALIRKHEHSIASG